MIAIIVAIQNEIFKNQFQFKKFKTIHQFGVVKFKIGSQKCVLVCAGIGIANAAAATQMLIHKFTIKEIYNCGAVGANHHLKVHDLVAPAKIFYHDVVTPWYARGQTPGEKLFYLNHIQLPHQNNLASGSSFVVDQKYGKQLKNALDVDIVDMEAAAIAQICDQNHIPFKVIKCVSDIIGQNQQTTDAQVNEAEAIAFQKTIEKISELT